MKNLFIDSNIWLSVYHFTKDDLDKFEMLKGLRGSEINLIIPEQVKDEVLRNRDNKLKDSLSQFEYPKIRIPAFCKQYDDYEEFDENSKRTENMHKRWKDQIETDIKDRNLPADIVLAEFFEETIPTSEDIIKRADLRCRRGNPPGKNNSIGDAINWETILEVLESGEDLYFISGDNDYSSQYDNSDFNVFLNEEWSVRKKSTVFYYKNLVSFLNQHIKEIKLDTERNKDELINGLIHSPNFATTHSIIKDLKEYDGWSEEQIKELCVAGVNNSQVNWILGDEDVYEFYDTLLGHELILDDNVRYIREFIDERKTEDEDVYF